MRKTKTNTCREAWYMNSKHTFLQGVDLAGLQVPSAEHHAVRSRVDLVEMLVVLLDGATRLAGHHFAVGCLDDAQACATKSKGDEYSVLVA